MARRAKALRMKVLVDLHYSDFWADPGKQWTPAAWQGQTFPQLKATFTDYTRGIVQALVDQGTPPDMIQLGNEINPGMLWDYAATWTGDSTADDGPRLPDGPPHRELGQPGRAADRRLRGGQGRLAVDEGDAAPRRGRRQRHLPLVVRQHHHAQRAVRRDRRLVLRVLARHAGGPPVQPRRRHGPLPQGHHRRRDRLCLHPR